MPNNLANLHESSAPVRRAYTVEEAMDALQVGRTVLFDLMRRKEITSVKIGRRRIIIAASLDAYLDRLVAEQNS